MRPHQHRGRGKRQPPPIILPKRLHPVLSQWSCSYCQDKRRVLVQRDDGLTVTERCPCCGGRQDA